MVGTLNHRDARKTETATLDTALAQIDAISTRNVAIYVDDGLRASGLKSVMRRKMMVLIEEERISPNSVDTRPRDR